MNLLNKKEFFFYIFLFIFISYLSNYIFASEFTNPNIHIGWFQKSLYELNYFDFGFIKRGLIGSIVKLSSINFDFIIKIISSLLVFFIAITYSIIILKQKDTQIIKYLLLFGVSPFFFSNIGLDLGRLDHFGLLFFILYILAILNNKNVYFFILTSPFLLFISEIHFFTVSIFIIYNQLFFKRIDRYLLFNIFLTILILLIILLFGGMDKELVNLYKDTNYAVDIYFLRGQIETSVYFWKLIFNFQETGIYRHLFSILLYIFVCFFYIKYIDKSFKSILLMIVYFTTFIIGIDHARFFSIFLFNIFFIIFLNHQINYKIYLPKFKNIFFFIVVIGPWGINKAFPMLTIIKKLFYKQIMF